MTFEVWMEIVVRGFEIAGVAVLAIGFSPLLTPHSPENIIRFETNGLSISLTLGPSLLPAFVF